MATKKPVKKTTPNTAQRLESIEGLIRSGFRQVDQRFEQVDQRFERVENRLGGLDLEIRDFKRNVDDRFAIVEDRIDKLANHVDGFMKLHETLDIEFKVLKEQLNRLEARLDRLEANRIA